MNDIIAQTKVMYAEYQALKKKLPLLNDVYPDFYNYATWREFKTRDEVIDLYIESKGLTRKDFSFLNFNKF